MPFRWNPNQSSVDDARVRHFRSVQVPTAIECAAPIESTEALASGNVAPGKRWTNLTSTASSDSPSAPFVVRSYGATDRGLNRPTNEDQFLIADLTKAMHVRQTSLEEPRARFGEQHGHLFLVADGMGGHHAGEHASAMAVALIEQFALNTFRWFMPLTAVHADNVVTDFQEAVERADATIVEAATKSPIFAGWSAANACVPLRSGAPRNPRGRQPRVSVSRQHLTSAHPGSYSGRRAGTPRRGSISPKCANTDSGTSSNVVGGTESGVQADAHTLKLHVDDELLLCSDGLTEMLSNAEISEVLRGEPNPEAACTRLISLANECGGQDNITAIVARFSASPATTGNAFGNQPPRRKCDVEKSLTSLASITFRVAEGEIRGYQLFWLVV